MQFSNLINQTKGKGKCRQVIEPVLTDMVLVHTNNILKLVVKPLLYFTGYSWDFSLYFTIG